MEFSTKILQKINKSIKNGFTKKNLKKPSVTNSVIDELEEDLISGRDSAYYSLSFYKSESEALEETETVNNTFDMITTRSRSSSFTTSPILTRTV